MPRKVYSKSVAMKSSLDSKAISVSIVVLWGNVLLQLIKVFLFSGPYKSTVKASTTLV